MTVAELIEALSHHPPNAPVYLGRQVDRRVRLIEVGWVGHAPAPGGPVTTIAWRDPARNLGRRRTTRRTNGSE